jgi:nitrogen-specific signal transduction histidine kinase/putative methionine-R-sulfoxide reductase with GAF domain
MVKSSARELKSLVELKESISAYSDLDEILKMGLRKTIEITNMDGGVIYLVDKSGELLLRAAYGLPDRFLRSIERMFLGEGITGNVAMNGKIEIVPDLSKDDRVARGIVKRFRIRTLVSIPLTGGDEIHGVMNIVSYNVNKFNQSDIGFLKKTGEFIGNAINNIIIYQRVQHQVERMRDLNDISLEMTMILNPVMILEKISEYVEKLFHVRDYAIVFNKNIKLISKIKSLKELRSPGFKRVRLGFSRQSLGRTIFETERENVVVINDYFSDARFPLPNKNYSIFRMPRSIMGSRLLFGRNNLGIIVIGSHKLNAFTQEDGHIFKLFSACVSGSIGNALVFYDLRNSFRRLRAAQKVIVKGEKIAALIRLTTQITHRIKNSLGAMQTSLDVLTKEDGLSTDGRELLEVLTMENKKLNKLVDDFFEFAGPERKSYENVQLPDFLNETVNTFMEESGRKDIKIIKQYDKKLSNINLSPLRFSCLIQRLLENAIESISDSSGVIEVGYRLMEKNRMRHRFVEFFVKDNGCGIEPALVPKVMEPFFTTKPGGNGLGLSIAERIAEQHGGSISIDSVKNNGTCVKVLIPLR